MSDNKQPDALDRLRRRPAPSTTPTPVAKETPLLNDEARKLLEEKTKAAALATKHAAEVGAKKSLEAGKAALVKFNSWRHERAEAKVKVEAPVEKLAPLEGITPAEVAEAVAEREAAVPVAEAPPMAVAPVDEDSTNTKVKNPGASDGKPSGLLIMDGMCSIPQGELRDLIDVVLIPGQATPLGAEEETPALINLSMGAGFVTVQKYQEARALYIEQKFQQAYEKLSAENPGAVIRRDGYSLTVVHPESIEEVLPEFVEAEDGLTNLHVSAKSTKVGKETPAPAPTPKPTNASNPKLYLIAGAVLAFLALGLIALKLIHRESSVAPVEPTSAPTSQPVAPAAVVVPVQATPAPEPAPVAVEPAPRVIEVAPVAPAPVVVPEVQTVAPVVAPAAAPAKPVAVEKPVAPPAPKPVAVAKTPAAVKPKTTKPAPAPVASPESKKQIDSIRDFEKQLKELGG